MVLTEEKVKLPAVVKKEVVQRLRDILRDKVAPEVEGHTIMEEVMVEVEEMPTSVTSVTNGDTGLLNVLKMSKADRGERMLLNLMKQRHYPKRWRMCLK